MKMFTVLIFALEILFKSASPAPFTEKRESAEGQLTLLNEKNDQPPKLRVLIITFRECFTESHYLLHRKLAELLASDEENVEKVLLLAMNSNCANQSTEEPGEYNGRLLVWTRSRVDSESGQSLNWPIWEEDSCALFLPNPNNLITLQLDILTNCQTLIEQLRQFQFNVGIMETTPWDFSLTIFRALPSIQKFAISQSACPTISQWHQFGYEKIVGAMPGKDLAQIGDHDFATEIAIKENPNYFLERNQNSYILPNQLATKLVEEKLLEAIAQDKLPEKNFEDVLTRENFSEWDFKHRLNLFITNTQPFLDFPIVEREIDNRKLLGHKNRIIFIGGITMPKGTMPNLSEATQQIFESAKNKNGGIVLLSFGSVVPMNDDEPRAVAFKNIVINLFSNQYPEMKLIIKWGKRPPIGTDEHYKKLSDNAYAKSWVEQSAILAKVPKLFITHGGQNSINEAVKFGVPLLLFPFFGDQFNNGEALAARGVAKVLDIRSTTLQHDLNDAIKEIFSNYLLYKLKIKELSEKFNLIDPANDFLDAFRQLRKSA